MVIKAIIFDKDGTLLELGETWDEPTVTAFAELMTLSNMSNEEIEAYGKELGIVEGKVLPNTLFASGSILEQAEELATKVPLSVQEINDMLAQSYLKFVKRMDVETIIVDGTKELLQYLRDQGYIIGLVTNDYKSITRVLLEAGGLLEYFDFIGCADEYHAKPNPAALYEMAKRFDITLDEMIYIGDSAIDMEYAKFIAHGIGVAFDDAHRDYVEEADYIVTELAAIPEIINEINNLRCIL